MEVSFYEKAFRKWYYNEGKGQQLLHGKSLVTQIRAAFFAGMATFASVQQIQNVKDLNEILEEEAATLEKE